jgi:hypothetical protein
MSIEIIRGMLAWCTVINWIVLLLVFALRSESIGSLPA